MKDTLVKIGAVPPPPPPKSKPAKKDGKMAARRTKEHKIPIMKVGKSKKPSASKKPRSEEPKRRRGRPKGGEEKPATVKKPAKKNEVAGARKRKPEAKQHSKDASPPPLKKPKTAMNGDAKVPVHPVHKPFSQQRGESNFKVENCTSKSVNSNGTLHSTKKTLMFNPKKNSISILKSATFHPPISLTTKKELLNGSSNISPFKLLPSKNKSSFKKEVDIHSLCKELETSSKIGVNNISPLSQLTVSNELGRNLAKDIVQFCSKEPSKSKDATKLLSKETAKCQSKESPKPVSKESSKIHPKETSKPQVKDSGKPQTKDSCSKSLPKEQAKPLVKDSAKPKDVVKPVAKEPSKSLPAKPQAAKETVRSQQQKELVQVVPVKSHPQRMASLDAMARMHVICTTDRKPPEPRHTSVSVCARPVTHQKSITQCHERIQFDLKKETNDMKGNIVHKQEINYVKEKQQVFVSHSVEQSSIVEREQSKTVSSTKEKKKKTPTDTKSSAGSCKKLIKAKPKPTPSSAALHSRSVGPARSERGKQPGDGDRKSTTKVQKKTVSKTTSTKCCVKEKAAEGGAKKKTKKVEQTKSEVKVKETIRMQKTCTYQSVTHTVNSSADSSVVVPVSSMTTNFSKTVVTGDEEECKKNKVNFSTASVINNSYCLTTTGESAAAHGDCCRFRHPQIIPLAHLGTTSDPSPPAAASPTTFSVHRFSHQPPSIIFAPAAADCGCCCSGSLVADSCLLRKSIVAYPHLPSHHAHHLSAPAFSSETVCSDCHPTSSPSPPRVTACCCCKQGSSHRLQQHHHLHHHHHHHHHHHQSGGGLHHYLSSQPKTSSSSLVPYAEQSPLDLSLTSTAAHRRQTLSCSSPLLCCRPEQQHQQLLLLRPHHACCGSDAAALSCSVRPQQQERAAAAAATLLASSPGPVHPAPVATTDRDSPAADDSLLSAKREKSLSPKQPPPPPPLPGSNKRRVFAHGWSWKGKPREKLIALTNDSIPCPRICYPSVEHQEGDTISERDCVLLRSGPKDTDLPYVAKVAAFWENPDDGEMMMSLLWYYRPEHTDQGRKTGQMEDEVFASRHKDVNSVACIEDKCYVLTYNEYCRYKASLSMDDDTVSVSSWVVPELPEGYPRKNRLPCEPVSQDIVFFCRHVYDFRQKRILKNPT